MNISDMRDQNWGLELEFTGIHRYDAAKVMSEFFGGPISDDGSYYDKYSVRDGDGRKWTVMSDGSIAEQRKSNGRIVSADRNYAVELVTPICQYGDIETLQQLVRKLRKAGAFVNPSCGIHVHVDGKNHTPQSVRNMINIVASKNALLYQALEIKPERQDYCKALDEHLIDQMNKYKPKTMEHIADIWYAGYPNSRTSHYHDSRYHFLNLHSFFNGNGTLEFRGYNATMHAGKVKSYIQLSLAMCHQAKHQRTASRIATQTDNPKYTFRTYLLRLGLIGPEFATCREHLLKPLPGDIAFRHPEQAQQHRERHRLARLEAKQQEQASEEIVEAPAYEPGLSL